MGLDMYLYKKTYVQNWDHMKPSELHQITVTKGGKPTTIKPERISYITEQVGYWRKANQIHKWFVDNVQDGKDDCGEYYVSREQLVQLRDLCRKVVDSVEVKAGKITNGTAAALLPAASGFFFGSTDYDSYYLQDVQDTVTMLDALLAEPEGGDFHYHSSW